MFKAIRQKSWFLIYKDCGTYFELVSKEYCDYNTVMSRVRHLNVMHKVKVLKGEIVI